jgi:DNA modification methylase
MKVNALVTLAELKEVSETRLPAKHELFDAVLIKTKFDHKNFGKPSRIDSENAFLKETKELIDKSKKYLKDGGLLFIWGLPNYLSFLGEHVSNSEEECSYLFKYWIAVELESVLTEGLPSSHVGLLMYLKSKSKKHPTPFDLNTKFVRIPYTHCPACGEINKDWGGKKHLLNPLGSAVSDVWDFHKERLKNNKIPQPVVERTLQLLGVGKTLLQINQSKTEFTGKSSLEKEEKYLNGKAVGLGVNEVVNESCIEYLKKLKKKNPNGVFDLAFADPPYNLDKKYSTYKDDRADEHYIQWCNEWLKGMYDNLKPGGALFVLNIPKWAIHHFNFLADKMMFKNWIVWDALSTPAGKFLPAHYSLLYFVKPGGKQTVNLKEYKLLDSRDYCLKASCIKKRKEKGDNEKELLTDIWKDVHRIKHKKDRDHHPCQLPTKFMERIIKLFSNEGDLIFDPFGGAGTTALASKILKRKFIITEIDPHYVKVSQKNLNNVIVENGEAKLKRQSVKLVRLNSLPKKQFEKQYMDLCLTLNKTLDESELKAVDPKLFSLKNHYVGDFNKLVSSTKRKIEANHAHQSSLFPMLLS